MNIDELKNVWNEDVSEQTPEISIEHTNKINLPLEKIRKNMRLEFWSVIGIFIFSFAVCAFCQPFKLQFYITMLVASMLFVTIFFYSKFFRLYNDISNPMLNTYDALKDLKVQFDLNKQYYFSYYLSFVPFIVCEMIIVIEFIPWPEPISDAKIAVILISAVVIGLFVLYLSGKFWFHRYYGRHFVHIENLLKELKK